MNGAGNETKPRRTDAEATARFALLDVISQRSFGTGTLVDNIIDRLQDPAFRWAFHEMTKPIDVNNPDAPKEADA